MSNSWFTHYRPRKVADLHLNSVRTQLQSLMTAERFPQVLLFTGPKGLGKTSSARIVAAMLNDPANQGMVDHLFFGKEKPKVWGWQEPDSQDELVSRIFSGRSLAVTEQDAASNRGIDDVRQLRERLFLPPAEGKIAVYILDEAHMLTTEAFNALLKVFEEPPAHVVFILATTEVHKIPDTIVSRAVVIPFIKASDSEVHQALVSVLEKEAKKWDEEAIAAVVAAADGSFRDAVKLLQTAASTTSHLTLVDVTKVIHPTSEQDFTEFIESIIGQDSSRVVSLCQSWRSTGGDESLLLRRLCHWLHHQLEQSLLNKTKTKFDQRIILFLLKEFSQIEMSNNSGIPLLSLELKALELLYRSQDKKTKPEPSKQEKAGSTPAPVLTPTPAKHEPAKVVAEAAPVATHRAKPTEVVTQWQEVVAAVKTKNTALGAVLGTARPSLSDTGLQLEVFYAFHRDQLKQPKFDKAVKDSIVSVTGWQGEITIVVGEQDTKANELGDLAKDILV
jgi:DNA polymerase III subunit gamma/tau